MVIIVDVKIVEKKWKKIDKEKRQIVKNGYKKKGIEKKFII